MNKTLVILTALFLTAGPVYSQEFALPEVAHSTDAKIYCRNLTTVFTWFASRADFLDDKELDIYAKMVARELNKYPESQKSIVINLSKAAWISRGMNLLETSNAIYDKCIRENTVI